MSREYSFRCPLPNGLHARPASLLQEVAARFFSEIHLLNERSGFRADAKSMLSLMSADLQFEDPCLLMVDGKDEALAAETLITFLVEKLPSCDEALSETISGGEKITLPRSLNLAPDGYQKGKIIQAGIAQGLLLCFGGWNIPSSLLEESAFSPSEELSRFQKALAKVSSELLTASGSAANPVQGELAKAHLAILNDPKLLEEIEQNLSLRQSNVGRAIHEAIEKFSAALSQSNSAYLRERVTDLRDIEQRLIVQIYGPEAGVSLPQLSEATILAAQHLTPSQFISLDRRFLQGLVLAEEGETSHTAILARSFGIPTLAGLIPPCAGEVILDGQLGILITELTPDVKRYYRRKKEALAKVRNRDRIAAKKTALSSDGKCFPVYANISSAEEVLPALENGAEGIGLFRTEMLFMDRSAPPDEQEQLDIYRRAAEAAAGRPLTIRTFDFGGDKSISYLKLPTETNPFLGHRGVRLYEEFKPLLKIQLRALLRASSAGSIRILFPMISGMEEAKFCLSLLGEMETELSREFPDTAVQVIPGLMLEIPSLLFSLKELCGDFSFFSIGSNDLLQYFFAADRDNPKVGLLSDPYSPSFLRALRMAAEEIHGAGCSLGLCGEIAARPSLLPLWLGLPLDNISLASSGIPSIKASLAKLSSSDCLEATQAALACGDSGGVRETVSKITSGRSRSLIHRNLIQLDSDAATKEEIIEDLVHLMKYSGRARNKAKLENAIWGRESVYSTAMEFGFAIPHCKSDSVLATSIAYLRLQRPVIWDGSGKEVSQILFLAMPDSGSGKEHLRTLAQLSRLLMRNVFREALASAKDPGELTRLFAHELGLPPV